MRFIILLALLITVGVATIQAQEYVPLMAEGKQWNVLTTLVPMPPYYRHTDAYKLEGDTVLDGMTYKMLHCTSGQEYTDWRLRGLLRETSEGKVYYRQFSWNQTFNSESMLYDFSMQPGDSLMYWGGDGLKLFSVNDTILEGENAPRKIYVLEYIVDSIPRDFYETWIEGIGSEYGLINPCSRVLVGGTTDLLCCYEDDDLIWQNPDYSDCYVDSGDDPTSFQSGNLVYMVLSTNPRCVSVVGHIDGENAQGELVIPEMVTYGGVNYTVTEIGEWAFKNCTGLTGQLFFPSTIDTIQEGAFYGCTGFTGTLDLSFSTAVLKEHVFRECSGFTELHLPLFISEIPRGLFCGCSGLAGALVLPESVEIVGEGAFARCSGFTSLVLPNGLREIREQAFSGCTGFTGSLVFPETVTHIKYQAFGRCAGFSGDLVIPNSVVELGNTQNSGYFINPEPTSTFADCFDHLVLSQSLDTIGPRCFEGCTRLAGDLVMPEGLKAIYAYAFEGCNGLTGLTLNDSLSIIGGNAFSNCTGISGTLTLPENINVGPNAFEWCTGIEVLNLPHNISFLADPSKGYVFKGCVGLTELDIPEGWTTIEQSNFSLCSNLTRVHLPESLTSIGSSAFGDCRSLEYINIPDGVTEICSAAFSKCRSLTHIELPANLRTLAGLTFARCTSLTGEVVIPDLVQRIDVNTFDSCYMLNRIVFGDSINYIAEYAFENTELSSIVLKTPTPPQLSRKTIQGAWHFPDDIQIIVPCGALEAYQNSEDWAGFTNISEDCGNGLVEFQGSEWYYEIRNDNGSITYQHLQQEGDTVVNNTTVVIIIRTNTLYDKGNRSERVTHEYIYEEDNVVYWWNKDLEEFTVLYDLGAEQGDSWVIKVGTETLTMTVDAVEQYYYEGRLYRMLQVSDDQGFFGGTIVCGIGHLTSFFPERLMTRGKSYRVEGIRCYWREGELVFKYGDRDCDEVYQEIHNGIEEDGPSSASGALTVYPNPTNGVLFVQTYQETSLPSQTYRIINLMGQTVLSGSLVDETQRIDVSALPEGMYFISVGDVTRKFVVNK